MKIVFIVIIIILNFIRIVGTFNIWNWVDAKERDGYNKLMPPGQLTNTVTNVQIQVYVESIGNFRASTMDYDLDIYFVSWWEDLRLTHMEPGIINLNDRQAIQRLWIPDIYFANSKSALVNDITVPNCVLKVSPTGSMRYSIRVSLKLSCNMNLKGYPMDSQTCHIKMVTYGNTVDKLNVTWSRQDPIQLDADIMEADFKIDKDKLQAGYCNGSYFGMIFSCLRADFYLERYIEYSLLRTYVPTIIVVAISWISFWIDPSSVPGRVGLAVTTLLTLFTQAIATQFHLPPVSYATGQDIWFGLCIMFQFFTLIEFAIVNMYTRRGEEALNKKALTDGKLIVMLRILGHDNSQLDDQAIGIKRQEMAKQYKRKAARIDNMARVVFPICFVACSVIYWSYYLYFIDN